MEQKASLRAVLLQAGIVVLVTVTAVSQSEGKRDCDTQFMSAAVVATGCTHAVSGHRVLDLLIIWRGAPGWFQRSENGGVVTDVTRDFARGEQGRVAQFTTYADITVGFDAHFDDQTVSVDTAVISLANQNAIVVDDVDLPHTRRIVKTLRVDPVLPERGNTLLIVARRSSEVRNVLECDADRMPARQGPGSPGWHRPRVATVCELLRR